MKKIFLLVIMLFQFICLATASCYLSRVEEKKALKKFTIPQSVKLKLDNFFSRSEVQDALLKSIIRQICLEQKNNPPGGYTYTNDQMLLWENLCAEQENKTTVLFKKYNIMNLAEDQEIKNYYVLTSEEWWPSFVIKIPRPRRYQETIDTYHFRSRYQNISRIFYNNQIKKLADAGLVNHVYPLQKFLYHIPRRPKSLSDENYLVVAEKIPNLPTIEENKKIFSVMIDKEKQTIQTKYLPFINDIITIIANIGLGDIAQQNIFFTKIHRVEQLVFVDTEKNSKCNQRDNYFFNKDFSEIDYNRRWGLFNFFVHFFSISPEYSTLLTNEILQQNKNVKKKQRYQIPKKFLTGQ